jgi:DNA-binding LytR/AlgR family response regulator
MRTCQAYLRHLVLFIAVVCPACGGSSKLRALQASKLAVDTIYTGMETFDRAHQIEIINGAKTRDEAITRIQAYRDQRAVIIEAFIVAYKALAAAAFDLSDLKYLEALAKAKDLVEEVKRFKELVSAPSATPARKLDLVPAPAPGGE